MRHLSNEECEQLLQGQIASEHLASCAQCQARLAEKKALAQRLKSAFTGVAPSADLVQRIREQTVLNADPPGQTANSRIISFQAHWRIWAGALSAIAALIILVPVLMIALAPLPAHAALVKIHEHNLADDTHFFSENDPNRLAAYFRDKLGFDPQLPQLEHGLRLRGCCVRHFKGDIVGSYVVETPEGIISVVVVSDLPQDLGMNDGTETRGAHIYWKGHFAKCKIVSTRIEDYTYCAVGDMPYNHLQTLLEKLLPKD